MSKRRVRTGSTVRAFTLIELLVVVAIIALLISILLPSLGAARDSARAVTCATNMRQVGQSVAIYLGENRATYPLSYAYPHDEQGNFTPERQFEMANQSKPYGYIHWSYFLYNNGQVNDKSFSCPNIPKGGHPRTNVAEKDGWENGQVGSDGSTTFRVSDKQATRMAFTANAAVMGRNKFWASPRKNRFVRENAVGASRRVVLVTEFWKDWKKIAVPNGTGFEAKAHRPVMVFDHVGGANTEEWEYSITTATGKGWTLGSTDDPDEFGLKVDPGAHPICGSQQYNAIGREHPGGDKFGGTTNFLYIDGGVARKTVFETMKDREWGESYYSLSGPSEIAYNR